MMDKEEKLEHIEILQNLLEKQKVMYTRLSLSDDPKAVEMKENLRKSVAMMGFPPETDMTMLFSSMNATIEALKNTLTPDSFLAILSKQIQTSNLSEEI